MGLTFPPLGLTVLLLCDLREQIYHREIKRKSTNCRVIAQNKSELKEQ